MLRTLAKDIIEFQTSINNGTIQIPQQCQQVLKNIATVSVVEEEAKRKISEQGIITRLRKEPKIVEELEFTTREKAHDRSL